MKSILDVINTRVPESLMDDDDAIMGKAYDRTVILPWFTKAWPGFSPDDPSMKNMLRIDGKNIDIVYEDNIQPREITVDIKKNPIPKGYRIRSVNKGYWLTIIGPKSQADIDPYIPSKVNGTLNIKFRQTKLVEIKLPAIEVEKLWVETTGRKETQPIITFSDDTKANDIRVWCKSVRNIPRTAKMFEASSLILWNTLVDANLAGQNTQIVSRQ